MVVISNLDLFLDWFPTPPTLYLSYFVVFLKPLYLWSIKDMRDCGRSYNSIYFTWPCVYDMIGICEQVWNWKSVPSDSEHCIVSLHHRLCDRSLCSIPGTSYCSCTDIRTSSIVLAFPKDQIFLVLGLDNNSSVLSIVKICSLQC